MNKKNDFMNRILVFICILTILSCEDKINRTLEIAGDNRREMEKVLKYFENSSDPLCYEAAKFLIFNMPSRQHVHGLTIDSIDAIFTGAVSECQYNRTKYFNESIAKINMSQVEVFYDISKLKADFIIDAIEYACNIWENSSWHNKYDKSIFFEYVLPYQLHKEPFSNWRATIINEYPMLNKDFVLSRRGVQIESELFLSKNIKQRKFTGASGGLAVMLSGNGALMSYKYNSKRQTKKRLIMKYSSTSHNLSAVVTVNGHLIDTIRLAPTRNMESFIEKWLNKPLPIEEGENTICISSISDTMCIDYIQLGAIEDFKPTDLYNFSNHYYSIINKESQKCISLDTNTFDVNKIVCLRPYSEFDSTQILRLDYSGYPLWTIRSPQKEKLKNSLQIEFGTAQTLAPGSTVSIGSFERRPFEQWLFIPNKDGYFRIMNKHTGLFLDVKKDSISGNEILVQNVSSDCTSQKWLFKKNERRVLTDNVFEINSASSEAMRVFDLAHQFEYYNYRSPFAIKASSIIKTKSGKCADETSFIVYLCRFLGIPAAYDFTPHWGNRSSSHSWSVILDKNGKTIPFYMGNMPGDTAHYFHSYIKPKVFRYRYSANRDMMKDMRHEKFVPEIFKNPHYTDVTNDYCKTVDVMRKVPTKHKEKKIAYICVFDNRNWVPVYYGRINNDRVTFKNMGCGIVYITAFYEDGNIIPFGNPFIVDKDGNIKDIKSNEKKLTKMKLLRKYPFMGAQDYFNSRMNGGQFQGSNNIDFSDSIVFHIHKGITNGNWYDIPVNTNNKFKYLRYIGGKGSFCNINELEFYGTDEEKIKGKIIGTIGEDWARKENVFDGNILTGFGAISPDGNWVGLKLDAPKPISRIRYIGRNDGNCIEIGDEYELYHWNNDGFWEQLGHQKAKANYLVFKNIPSSGLYILKDITKGVEERIFTYEQGKQIWW